MGAFIPGGPKEAESITLAKLKKSEVKITAAKTVGGGTIKLFVDGPKNFYISDSRELRVWLWQTFGIEP